MSWFSNLFGPPDPASAGSGEVFDRGSKWPNRIGLFGAGLQDAGSYLMGDPSGTYHLAGYRKGRTEEEQRLALTQASQAFQAALASGDEQKIIAAGRAYAAAGGDPNALDYGRSKFQQGGDNPGIVDMNGRFTPQAGGSTKPPPHRQTVRGGIIIEQDWDPVGRKWVDTSSGPRWQGDQARPVTRVPHPSAGWQ